VRESNVVSLAKKEKRFYDVNIRSVLAMTRIGRGHSGLRKFCGVMNLPPPIGERAFIKHQKAATLAAISVAKASMKHAAEEPTPSQPHS